MYAYLALIIMTVCLVVWACFMIKVFLDTRKSIKQSQARCRETDRWTASILEDIRVLKYKAWKKDRRAKR